MSFLVKICGLRTVETLDVALAAGVDMVGFVFFARSPRHLALAEARTLSRHVRGRAAIVALTVDAPDAVLADIIEAAGPDLLQLHGSEPPARVAEIRRRLGRPVMKAIGIAGPADLAGIPAYDAVVDRLLFDAKAPKDARHPGGNGLAFDWRLLAGLDARKPAMLSGGLDPSNVADAIGITGITGVDVSSGVESAPGIKDPERIAAFVAAARAAAAVAATAAE
jgi:phosphoribosylanthranilate isomerase